MIVNTEHITYYDLRGLRFRSFAQKGSLFCITILFLLHLCAVCIKTHTFDTSLLFSELIHTQQEVKLSGPAFSSPAIWSVIFQVLHFPGLAFSVSPLNRHYFRKPKSNMSQ